MVTPLLEFGMGRLTTSILLNCKLKMYKLLWKNVLFCGTYLGWYEDAFFKVIFFKNSENTNLNLSLKR